MADTPPNTRIELGLALLWTMTRIRAFETAARDVHAKGEIPGVLHLSIGQEAVPAGVCAQLRRDDTIASTHRGHGHCIAKGAATDAMMAELYGRVGGTCRGKGGSMHIADFTIGMLGANGVVGGGIGIAVGAAQAARLLGDGRVSVCFFGDGAVNRGPFLEGLNWARIYDLPVLFVCEDNGFAAFTRPTETTGGLGAAARAEAIGIPAERVDGNDALAVHDAAARAIARCRRGDGPAFLYAPTYRLDGHTIADRAPYRTAEEVAARRAADPIERLAAALREQGAGPDAIANAAREAESEMARAIAFARGSAIPAPADAFADVQDLGAPA
ncbi:MAG: thiamine pyrophosphate-dependent dehydrogenase E1 component subunit alpha [Alphaproteobacteria bacterium]|nr:thiamine pyrophosphate-dependent dehydrogenase E1 component subunit alpha [Alphaproteobacteria bacterium]